MFCYIESELSVLFLHLMSPYFFSISVVFSRGRASTVCPRPVIVVARSRELYTASSLASITARNSGDIASFGGSSMCRGDALPSDRIRSVAVRAHPTYPATCSHCAHRDFLRGTA